MNKQLIMAMIIVSFLIIGKVNQITAVSSPRNSLVQLMEEVQALDREQLGEALETLCFKNDDFVRNSLSTLTYDIIDITEEGDLAQIWMIVQLEGAKPQELKVLFKRQGDAWKSMVSASEMLPLIFQTG